MCWKKCIPFIFEQMAKTSLIIQQQIIPGGQINGRGNMICGRLVIIQRNAEWMRIKTSNTLIIRSWMQTDESSMITEACVRTESRCVLEMQDTSHILLTKSKKGNLYSAFTAFLTKLARYSSTLNLCFFQTQIQIAQPQVENILQKIIFGLCWTDKYPGDFSLNNTKKNPKNFT